MAKTTTGRLVVQLAAIIHDIIHIIIRIFQGAAWNHGNYVNYVSRKQSGGPAQRLGISRAFTLVELLVVVVIVSILASMLAPALGQVRERARRVVCMNNLRQVGLAQYQYANDNGGKFYWMGGTANGGTLGASSGWAWMGLSNYVRSSQTLYCPSATTKDLSWPPANTVATSWAQVPSVHNSYGYVYYQDSAMSSRQILVFETPNYYFHEKSFGLDTFGFSGAPFDYFELDLGTGFAYKSDGTAFVGGMKPETKTAHGKDGSNILFVDGRVEWKAGDRIGPFYTFALPDLPGRWWSANGWGLILIY